eukprot:Pgem_evm1s16613
MEVTDAYQVYRCDVSSDNNNNEEDKDKIDDSVIVFAVLPGITAAEICKYFYNLDTRKEWE